MKKQGIAILAVAALSTVLIGGTLAYLNDTTAEVTNTFSSSKDIKIELREPEWDGFEFGNDTKSDGTEYDAEVAKVKDLGVEQAASYVPGQEIPKNPMVKNMGVKVGDVENGVPARVALKVEYLDANDTAMTEEAFTAAYLDKAITFSTNWTKLDEAEPAYDVYLYNTELAVGVKTDALFTEIPLSWTLEADEEGLLPGFSIKVTAYALQGNVPADKLNAEMLAFIKG